MKAAMVALEGMSTMSLRQVSKVTTEVVVDCRGHGRMKGASEMCGGHN